MTHRFINADSLATTGAGILGYNMFAYCNNSSVVFSDPTGHSLRPFSVAISDSGGNSKEYDASQDNRTTFEAVCNALFESLECEIGVGMGLYGSAEYYSGAVGVTAGYKGDFAQFALDDGEFSFRQKMVFEFTVSLYSLFDFGFSESYLIEPGGTTTMDSYCWYNNQKESISIFNGGAYLICGGSFDISFNILEFFERLEGII